MGLGLGFNVLEQVAVGIGVHALVAGLVILKGCDLFEMARLWGTLSDWGGRENP